MKKILLLFAVGWSVCAAQSPKTTYPFRDTTLTVDERVEDLISRLTLSEKVQMMKHQSPAIERLGVPAYNWRNEALHGVARTKEKVTVFPQAIGLAATFDEPGLQKTADMISSEGRALFNEDLKAGKTGTGYRGLTYWTPNVNIFRDPRWGRGQETYGEDPYLSAQMGMAMVRGLEGNDPKFLKAVACAKHYAVHSGPEGNRHTFNAQVDAYDLWDTYLPAFQALVTEAKVHGVMCAYNRLDGQPCCGHNELLHDILRNQWGFDGYVTSDCWALKDFAHNHKTHANDIEAVSDAVLKGTDLECGDLYQLLEQGVNQGLISERSVNVSLKRLLTILFKIGLFDPDSHHPYMSIDRRVLECPAHQQQAYEMACKSMVLLENKKNILPLNPKKLKRIAMIGPNANDEQTLLGNYNGFPSEIVTPVESFTKQLEGQVEIDYMKGVDFVQPLKDAPSFKEVAARAKKADVIIFVSGINANYEGEAGDAGAAGYGAFSGGDRTTIQLPQVQIDLLKELKKTGRPLILVNMSGSVMSFDWESRNADAILQCWYGGQSAGDAIFDILFGEYNPSGRMPLTTYMNDGDLPPFEDYSMQNRTYRYFQGDVRYPFGYGLSYTTFAFDECLADTTLTTGKTITYKVNVTNTGKRAGDEVVQLYVAHQANSNKRQPICALKGFKRVSLQPGETQEVTFELTPKELALVNQQGELLQQAGHVDVYIGGGQPYKSEGVFYPLSVTGEVYKVY